MASSPIDLPVRHFTARDGTRLAWRETGEGRPLVLIHGYFSTAYVNWIKYGHAAALAARGIRVLMPDLRGHGDSDKPHDPAAYRPDVLRDDGFDFVAHLGLSDGEYDLAGYSLGGRTSLRMLVGGARPERAVLCGMGLEGIVDTRGRGDYFRHVLTHLGSFQRGLPEWLTEAFLKTTGGDPVALLGILDTFVDTAPADIAALDLPVLVVTGEADDDNGSAEALAGAIPGARYQPIPGNHMSAVTRPELGTAIGDFLDRH